LAEARHFEKAGLLVSLVACELLGDLRAHGNWQAGSRED
jgi:hypothetical protein